jgi:hypothetical protein
VWLRPAASPHPTPPSLTVAGVCEAVHADDAGAAAAGAAAAAAAAAASRRRPPAPVLGLGRGRDERVDAAGEGRLGPVWVGSTLAVRWPLPARSQDALFVRQHAAAQPGGPGATHKLTMTFTMFQKTSVTMLARYGDRFCCTAPAARGAGGRGGPRRQASALRPRCWSLPLRAWACERASDGMCVEDNDISHRPGCTPSCSAGRGPEPELCRGVPQRAPARLMRVKHGHSTRSVTFLDEGSEVGQTGGHRLSASMC